MRDKNDILFLASKTNLSNRKIKLLTEEDRDFNLLIDSISDQELSREEINDLSFEFISKFIIFKFSQPYSLNVVEKEYVCNVFIRNFKELLRTKNFKKIPEDFEDEAFAGYAFIIVGFFSHRLSPESYKKYRNYLNFFRGINKGSIHKNLEIWLKIFNEMKTKEIFL